jgi:hypothetical protein
MNYSPEREPGQKQRGTARIKGGRFFIIAFALTRKIMARPDARPTATAF